ncbi:hypothetical protein B0T21DRAFT_104893 [Apiosordaria backusii]|uniref:Uncharacterized protein n=1 Tax=Apiosordaria backusii TaxID=314023 RepID=A0AA40DKJ1_9PEZI|nr:hypothetical protein B0T21DRAFT_104893 [Apiosordaria backusii]
MIRRPHCASSRLHRNACLLILVPINSPISTSSHYLQLATYLLSCASLSTTRLHIFMGTHRPPSCPPRSQYNIPHGMRLTVPQAPCPGLTRRLLLVPSRTRNTKPLPKKSTTPHPIRNSRQPSKTTTCQACLGARYRPPGPLGTATGHVW